MKWLVGVGLLVSGCDEAADECVDGLCPDFSYSVARLGPCHTELDRDGYTRGCSYAYVGDLLTRVRCYSGTVLDSSTWIYDGMGALSRVDFVHDDIDNPMLNRRSSWVWNGDVVEQTGTSGYASYEASSFTFLPALGGGVAPPLDLTRLTEVGATYELVQDGNVFTRTKDDGYVVTWELDDHGHMTRLETPYSKWTWQYRGDRVVAYALDVDYYPESWSLSYDAGGNLALRVDDEHSYREVFDYSCW
jgi:hypothetical protein